MLKNVAITLFSFLAVIGFVACESGTDNFTDDSLNIMTNTQISSFSLQDKPSVLEHLDSVFFSIDLKNAEVFNADSLPMGTRINALLVNMEFPSASKVELKYRTRFRNDTVIEYKTDSSDSINFASGPVTLTVTSLDGKITRDYKIKVNVHNLPLDTIVWNVVDNKLPSNLQSVASQRTVQFKDEVYCLTSSADNLYNISVAANPLLPWTTKSVDFGFTPVVESFTAADNEVFILSDDNTLYKSTDALTWTSTGETDWISITGAYNGGVLGVKKAGSIYYNVSYPAGKSSVMPDNFPVYATSNLFTYSTKWAPLPQAIMVGGRTIDGKTVGDTWAYDGSAWALTSYSKYMAAEGLAMVPYYRVQTSSVSWTQTKEDILLAFGGKNKNGDFNRIVYMSKDLGFNWEVADSLMQLPPMIPSLTEPSVMVLNEKMTISRAVAPITNWNVPYIFIFGGLTEDKKISETIYRGVLTNLTFKPLQ